MMPSFHVEVSGTIPAARFGMTVTQITPNKVVIFGGATGSSGNFAFTNDTYIFEIQKKHWRKIQSTFVFIQLMALSRVLALLTHLPQSKPIN